MLHSVRCPGIAARIAVRGFTIVYSGDIVAFEDPDTALPGADLYIGDGSTLTGSLVRRHPSGALIGHTTVRAQLGWLARHGIPRAIFSHFGKGPIEMGDGALEAALTSSRARRRRAAPSPRRPTGWSSRSGCEAVTVGAALAAARGRGQAPPLREW